MFITAGAGNALGNQAYGALAGEGPLSMRSGSPSCAPLQQLGQGSCELQDSSSSRDCRCKPLLLAGVIAGALLALWDAAAARCPHAGSWCAQAFSGTRTSSSANSFPDGSSHSYYQAVPDEMPAEYWVRCMGLLAVVPPAQLACAVLAVTSHVAVLGWGSLALHEGLQPAAPLDCSGRGVQDSRVCDCWCVASESIGTDPRV